MSPADLPAAHGLSAQLNWPHRLEDWSLLQRTFKGFVACVDDQLIGTDSVLIFSCLNQSTLC
jgi:hypothetical protein